MSNINNLDIVCESKITDAGYVCVSKFFDSDVSRVILVKKRNFLEVFHYEEIKKLRDEIFSKFNVSDCLKDRERYRLQLEQINQLLTCNKQRVCSYGNYRIVYLSTEILEKYFLEKNVILEGKRNYIKVWNPVDYKFYQEELRKEDLKKCFIQRMNERKKEKENLMNENGDEVMNTGDRMHSIVSMDLNGLTILSMSYFFPDAMEQRFVFVRKTNFVEIWERSKINEIRDRLEFKIENIENIEEKMKYQVQLNKVYKILVEGTKKLVGIGNRKFFNLPIDIIDSYFLNDGIILEGRGDHIRIWNVHKFNFYQEELKKKELESKFLGKIKERTKYSGIKK